MNTVPSTPQILGSWKEIAQYLGKGVRTVQRWELVLHMAIWQDIAGRRLGTEVIADPPPEVDWPPIPNPSDAAWKLTLRDLEQSYQNLRQSISQLTEQRLDEIVPGKRYSVYVLLHGVIQHNLYHAGQIAILKKLALA